MNLEILHDVPLSAYVTFKTGGSAKYFAKVTTATELEQAVYFAEQNTLSLFVLGGGSNMLVSDAGFSGLVLHMSISGRNYTARNDSVYLTVGAGEILDDVIAETVERGLWGLENLSHIPGTVGATPVQNVGAYGTEVSHLIESVNVFDSVTKKFFILKNYECHFSYRHSLFKEKNNFIITSVTYKLSATQQPKISYADLKYLADDNLSAQIVRNEIIKIRNNKFPDWSVVGTAGSFFKNPIITKEQSMQLLAKYPDIPTYPEDNNMVKVSLGYILDKICGLKGFANGHVRLFEKQALVVVVERGATTNEIKNFAKEITDIVFEKTFIKISQEVSEI
jgi:UDP-N-acetylmuramate dehydrogenase